MSAALYFIPFVRIFRYFIGERSSYDGFDTYFLGSLLYEKYRFWVHVNYPHLKEGACEVTRKGD